MDKSELRKVYLKKREGLKKEAQSFALKSERLSSHVHQFLKEFPKQSLLFGYRAYGAEAPLPWVEGFRWAYPKIIGPGEMDFYEVSHPDHDFKVNTKGILEPDVVEDKKRKGDQAQVVFVPGVAFDSRGFRLGFGKGFYDRFLAPLTGVLKVGIGFEAQLHSSWLPVDSWDLSMDWLITDKEVIGFLRR